MGRDRNVSRVEISTGTRLVLERPDAIFSRQICFPRQVTRLAITTMTSSRSEEGINPSVLVRSTGQAGFFGWVHSPRASSGGTACQGTNPRQCRGKRFRCNSPRVGGPKRLLSWLLTGFVVYHRRYLFFRRKKVEETVVGAGQVDRKGKPKEAWARHVQWPVLG